MISELAWPPPPWLGVVPPQALAFSLFPGRARAGSWVLLLFSCHFCACFSKLPEQNWAETSSQPASAACWGRHWAACGAGNQPSALPGGGMQQPPGPAPCVEGCAGAVLAGGGGGGALLPPPQPRSWSRDGRGLVPDPSDAVVLSSSVQSRVWGSLGHLTVGPGRVGCAGWWLLP